MNHTLTETPPSLDWFDLMAKAERRGIPVMRVDRHGEPHLLRYVTDLAAWRRR